MKYSGIGGQAVMEGVMMKNKDRYAVAVRKEDGEITVTTEEYKGITTNGFLHNCPILRGVVGFIESLSLGLHSLTLSMYLGEDTIQEETEEEKKVREKKEKGEMGITMCISVLLAVGIFMMLPYGLSLFFARFISSHILLALVEGLIRLAIFFAYVIAISQMKDIQRVFMYHGAEHKCINCIEHGMELTVENVRKSSRQHKRCGTSMLLFVMVVSIVFFTFITVENRILRVVLRLLLIPVIAGVSYEFIRLAGRTENKFVNLLSKPGLWLQNLTTREPDDSMIEVGIASVEAVFDWKKYLEDYQ
ncbi:MAG: DUF1385 domain-containing protein [Roseburia sp.]